MGVHERVDIEFWKREFPLEWWRERGRRKLDYYRRKGYQPPATSPEDDANSVDWYAMLALGGDLIVGPGPLALVEQIRAERLTRRPPKRQQPVDIFVWARGEPARPDGTKVGGVPYWPADRPWPCDDRGRPLAFLAQLNFADSLDIMPPLPGVVLVIFTEPMGYITPEPWRRVSMDEVRQRGLSEADWADWEREPGWDPEAFHAFWLPADLAQLIAPETMPDAKWNLAPLHGHIYRTNDYLWESPRSPEDEDEEEEEEDGDDEDGGFPGVLSATKIGGVPRQVQYDPRLYGDTFLATLGETIPSIAVPYPLLNVPPALDDDAPIIPASLKWGDSGLLHLMMTDDRVLCIFECC